MLIPVISAVFSGFPKNLRAVLPSLVVPDPKLINILSVNSSLLLNKYILFININIKINYKIPCKTTSTSRPVSVLKRSWIYFFLFS